MALAAPRDAAPAGQKVELADILIRYGPAYEQNHRLTRTQRKAMHAIMRCRTAALGGHHQWCPRCGFERYLYHSCRNRHCPKCQAPAKDAWLAARQRELLPVPYFHNVFTLPHELHPLILRSERNGSALLNLLFQAAAQTLLQFGNHELGGKLGFTMVLHTWDQQLRPHFHVHVLVAAGALAHDRSRWIAGGRKFLFPVRALSKVFRAKYLDGLVRLLQQGQLDLPTHPQLNDPAIRQSWLKRLRKKPWVVYSQAPFAGPRKLLDYLGRYTHRVAIANHRILSCNDGQVCFTYRDRRDHDRPKTAIVPAEEFLDRFLKHVLPSSFMRIRHYGFLANCVRKKNLLRCRELLGVQQLSDASDQPETLADWLRRVLGIDPTCCPCCRGPLYTQEVSPLPVIHRPITPTINPWDTS